jgi:phage/plasmid primase-like uncharacterized protein
MYSYNYTDSSGIVNDKLGISMSLSFESALEDEIARCGFDIAGQIDYSNRRFQRFKRISKSSKGKDIFVILIENKGACFGDWHDPCNWITWFQNPSYESKKEIKEIISKIKKEEAIERAHVLLEIESLIQSIHCKEVDLNHPYLIKKQIRGLYCGQIENKLVIPVYGQSGKIQSIQYIYPDGKKLFHKGTSALNGFILLGENIDNVLRICEGWATGCSIYDAVSPCVAVAFNCSNLKNVAQLFRSAHPKLRIIICADNDQYSPTNVGLDAAKYCAKNFSTEVFYPDFSGCDISSKPTDFNDLLCLKGIEEVERQLL